MNGPMLENVVKSVLLKPGCVFLRFWSIFLVHSALENNMLTYLACADKITVSFKVQRSTTECGPKIQKKLLLLLQKWNFGRHFKCMQQSSVEMKARKTSTSCEQLFGLTLNIYINANSIGRPPSAAYILMGPDTHKGCMHRNTETRKKSLTQNKNSNGSLISMWEASHGGFRCRRVRL